MQFKVSREIPLYEQIYTSLKEMILSGELEPEERLVDTHIAKKYQVSRSPIREAFRKLEQEGLIKNDSGNISVYNPSIQDLIELYQVRSGLESVGVYWAAQNPKLNIIQDLERIIKETKVALENNQFTQVIQLNTQFHDLFLKESGNARLQKMMFDIKDLIQLYRIILFKQQSNDYDFLPDHIKILEAYRKGNSTLASQYMIEHIKNDIEYFKKLLH